MHSDKADYSLLLENLRQAFYAIKNNPYTNGGSIFYIDQEDSAKKIRDEHVKKSIDKNRNITIGKFYQDRIDRYKAFFTIGEYQDFIGHYTTSLPTGSSSVQVNKALFWIAHLAGWKRLKPSKRASSSPDDPQLYHLFTDTKGASRRIRSDFKKDLEKIKFDLTDEEKLEFYVVGDDVPINAAVKPIAEYVVLCNYQLVKEYVGGRRDLLKTVINNFALNMYDAERNRREHNKNSLIPDNEEEVRELCGGLTRMLHAYDQLPKAEVDKKDWLLSRSLTWLVMGAMLRNSLSMELLNSSLKPYLPDDHFSGEGIPEKKEISLKKCMVQKYKKISIIFGKKSHDFARRINELIWEKHKRDGIPVVSSLLSDPFVSSEDIVEKILDVIKSSDACVIILTCDESGVRIPSNLLVEIGMALVILGKEKCYAVSDADAFLADSTNDIVQRALNLNPMDLQDPNGAACEIVKWLQDKFQVTSNKGLLQGTNYIFNHRQILNDIPLNIFEEKSDIQMKHILECWKENIQSFTFTEERIYYALERVTFFPIFTNNHRLHNFFNGIKEAIREEVPDLDGNESPALQECRKMVLNVIDYIDCGQKLQKGGKQKNNGKIAVGEDNAYKFNSIADQLESFISKCENDSIAVSWYILIIAHDYAALARMKYVQTLHASEQKISLLKNIISHFLRIESVINEDTSREGAGDLWLGYTRFNLSRAYKLLLDCYKETNLWKITADTSNDQLIPATEDELIIEIRNTIKEAIMYRKNWINEEMKGIFGKALSYEYFISKQNEYTLRETLPGYYNKTRAQTIQDLRDTIASLNVYCEATGLEKLLYVKDSLTEMERKLQKS